MHPGPILIGLPGTELDEAGRQHLRHPAVGGVVLFARNFSYAEQLDTLLAEIRALRDPRLLIAIDQEGGRVQRLQEGFTRLPPLGVLGRLHADDSRKALDMAYRHGRVMATEMLATGIDLSFAPVLDLDRGSSVIGDRALSPDPATVVALGRAYVAGMHDAGMKATGKHFPGHGSVVADSHIANVIDDRPLTELFAEDLMPFRDLAGQLDAIMMAHVTYPRVDPQPAGYSETWIGEILRGQLGYRGVVISDDLGMHAAHAAGSLAERTERCLQAGCELVLICQPEDVAELLAGWDAAPAGTAVSRLYGRPTVNRRELNAVNREGIREWRHWQRTVAALGEQSWT